MLDMKFIFSSIGLVKLRSFRGLSSNVFMGYGGKGDMTQTILRLMEREKDFER